MRGTARDNLCQSQIEALEQQLVLKAAHLRIRHQNGCRLEVEEVKQRLAAEREDVERELKKVRMGRNGGRKSILISRHLPFFVLFCLSTLFSILSSLSFLHFFLHSLLPSSSKVYHHRQRSPPAGLQERAQRPECQ